jgi:hypothetical protein
MSYEKTHIHGKILLAVCLPFLRRDARDLERDRTGEIRDGEEEKNAGQKEEIEPLTDFVEKIEKGQLF